MSIERCPLVRVSYSQSVLYYQGSTVHTHCNTVYVSDFHFALRHHLISNLEPRLLYQTADDRLHVWVGKVRGVGVASQSSKMIVQKELVSDDGKVSRCDSVRQISVGPG